MAKKKSEEEGRAMVNKHNKNRKKNVMGQAKQR
jgi:hypothetical protein